MAIAGLTIGAVQFFADLAIKDEKKRRAANAAIAAGIGAALTPLDPTAAAVGAVLTAKELAGLAATGAEAKGLIDAGGGVLGAAITGSVTELAKASGAAATGATVGYATGGARGSVSGLSMGGSLGSGNLESIAGKAAGAGAGALIARAAASEAEERDAVMFAMKLGMSAGGNIAGLCAAPATAEQQRALMRSFITDEGPEANATQMKDNAATGLALTATQLTISGILYVSATDKDERSMLDALESGAELGQAASSAAGLFIAPAETGPRAGLNSIRSSISLVSHSVAASTMLEEHAHQARARSLEREAKGSSGSSAARARREARAESESAQELRRFATGTLKLAQLTSRWIGEKLEVHRLWVSGPPEDK